MEQILPNKIHDYIESNKVLSYCTSVNNQPHCATCFYSFLKEGYLVFKSDRKTKHIENALINKYVSGIITPSVDKVGVVKGIQFLGGFIEPKTSLLKRMRTNYHHKFPFAIPMTGDIWGIQLTGIKMTDNTLGFGKKIKWGIEV